MERPSRLDRWDGRRPMTGTGSESELRNVVARHAPTFRFPAEGGLASSSGGVQRTIRKRDAVTTWKGVPPAFRGSQCLSSGWQCGNHAGWSPRVELFRTQCATGEGGGA